ncbi:hypothetical protein ACQ4WX_04515 [Streptomyces lasalocidi]
MPRKPRLLILPILEGSHELVITRLKHVADSFHPPPPDHPTAHRRFAVVGHGTGMPIGYAPAADHPDRVNIYRRTAEAPAELPAVPTASWPGIAPADEGRSPRPPRRRVPRRCASRVRRG